MEPRHASQRPLAELAELLRPGEVPVGALHVTRQPHDVITVRPVGAGAYHVVQHEVKVVGGGGVADKEQARVSAHRAERH